MFGLYNPSDHYWIVAGDETRVFASARRVYVPVDDAAYVAWFAERGRVTRIDTEANLWDVLLQQAPQCLPDDQQPRRKVAKSLIISRVTDEQLAAAIGLMTLRQQERWRAPDQPEVYFDDPETVAVLTAVGADTDAVLAP